MGVDLFDIVSCPVWKLMLLLLGVNALSFFYGWLYGWFMAYKKNHERKHQR